MFANVLGDRGSIPGQVIPKTQKMVLDTALLNTQHYKVRIKGKVEQSRERSSTPTLHLGAVAIEKGSFWSPSSMVTNYSLSNNTLYSYTIVCNYIPTYLRFVYIIVSLINIHVRVGRKKECKDLKYSHLFNLLSTLTGEVPEA